MSSGILIRSELLQWQINLLEGKVKPTNDSELEWLEKHDMDILSDGTPMRVVREREFCPPTFIAMSAKDD
ncbi:MAG: hypothetical protein UR39_C0004G0022 [Candidatus Woesebacteria bacterium GW2011_GWA1_33_30]|uniref:Uncharacterized protein n=1 Tax=Candidatus Woesebacteria bacterium GW2011_GWA2_33_28 TaxID=1618561 RepID=A0A0F9ZT62_9BACT|nr:MAG: hypothetical protein UR38_C0004G0051 [Candidatus Woesebacteria bacterium GW2011_GWA2_33_28]KKP48401.1 MAG: hypothetical protein UR39_C0004G0022 [Candidatus Woesebacteria bacterium GW2011_GWA1_33_30]KKP49508.1 MAG: hypothetical protein UR40_C0005G0022 [Microgenomates group bacterium GW2011_GWC1_33_32]KKP52473.1 MAG: hypothetical protein UR44_C0002G0022 [Candidatus Woesebacteria bacterium GW2011_GWB1_33_38]KKP58331.1 MAG: hypothetical protein UR48_C0005G0009 [Microgenomates group bacteriu